MLMMPIKVYSWLIGQIFPILASICLAMIFAIMYYSHSVLPWSLWKHLCIDTVTVLTLPVLLTQLSSQLSDIYEFCLYENRKPTYDVMQCSKDVRVYPWYGFAYYDRVTSIGVRYTSIAFDVSKTEVEREIGVAGSSRRRSS